MIAIMNYFFSLVCNEIFLQFPSQNNDKLTKIAIYCENTQYQIKDN